MAKTHTVKTAGDMRTSLNWVIKYQEMIRDGLSPKKGKPIVITIVNPPLFDIDCAHVGKAPSSDPGRLLDATIKEIKKVRAQLGKVPRTFAIGK